LVSAQTLWPSGGCSKKPWLGQELGRGARGKNQRKKKIGPGKKRPWAKRDNRFGFCKMFTKTLEGIQGGKTPGYQTRGFKAKKKKPKEPDTSGGKKPPHYLEVEMSKKKWHFFHISPMVWVGVAHEGMKVERE